jgi:hypothetical protein
MAITTMDQLVAALGAAQDLKIFFPTATTVTGGFLNLNRAVTGGYGQMAIPTAFGSGGTTYNQSTAGAGFPTWTPAAVGETSYIGGMGASMAAAGSMYVYDLCWACSGLSGNTNAPQSVVGFSGLPARHADGVGLEIWVCCSTAIGGTAHNVTVSYTNQAGVAGRTTVSTAGIASMPAARMYQLPLQNGDTGVQSIQSMTLSAASGTAGNVWLMILERYVGVGCVVANVMVPMDFAATRMASPDDEACLLFIHQGTGTSSGVIMGQLDIIQG